MKRETDWEKRNSEWCLVVTLATNTLGTELGIIYCTVQLTLLTSCTNLHRIGSHGWGDMYIHFFCKNELFLFSGWWCTVSFTNCIPQSCIASLYIFSNINIPLRFTTKIMYAFFLSPIHATCLAYQIILNLMLNVWQAVQIVKLLIIHFSPPFSYFCTLNCKYLHWCHILLHCYVFPCVYIWDHLSHAYMCMCTQ